MFVSTSVFTSAHGVNAKSRLCGIVCEINSDGLEKRDGLEMTERETRYIGWERAEVGERFGTRDEARKGERGLGKRGSGRKREKWKERLDEKIDGVTERKKLLEDESWFGICLSLVFSFCLPKG